DQAPFPFGGPTVVGHGSRPFLRELRDRQLNAMVCATTAKIAAEPMADIFGTGTGMLFEKCLTGDNKPRRAEAALRAVVVYKGLPHRVGLGLMQRRLERSD